ncbi:MAG: cell division ATP-binding protein FtsE [Candidatus Doudnabacteria bacterium]|nr:cell division ATP-binding protein FtsE [Candidatus Doudnabacteria bacterium]
MIQFQQVKKQYPGNDFVLGEVDLHVDEGEFVFLIGPSGSGKTTLIRMLIREEKPTSGKIYFEDRDITNLSRNNIYKLRRQVGVIFQDYKLIPDKNSYENVAFAMEAAGKKDREIKETVPYVLDIVGLTHRAKAFPAQLSGGEKQRIAIARAVANNPRVLIADEPTGNLDPASAWDIVQILSKINNWGTTVIMSTHGTDIVNTLNKRVVEMEGGKIVRDDKKGVYEVTTKFEERMLDDGTAEQPDKQEERKGPIKVNIDNAKETEQAKSTLNLSWLKIWNKEKPIPVEDAPSLVENAEQMEEVVNEANTALDKEAEEVVLNDEQEVERIIQDADKTPVDKLDLRPEVIADLKTAGYLDVEDIIAAGPEQLAKELIIDPEEVVLVSKAVSEFVKEEDQKFSKQEEKPEEEHKLQVKKDTKSKRVKLSLIAK